MPRSLGLMVAQGPMLGTDLPCLPQEVVASAPRIRDHFRSELVSHSARRLSDFAADESRRPLRNCSLNASSMLITILGEPKHVSANVRMHLLAMPASPLRVKSITRVTVNAKSTTRAFPREPLANNLGIKLQGRMSSHTISIKHNSMMNSHVAVLDGSDNLPFARARVRGANIARPSGSCRHRFPAAFIAPFAKVMKAIEVFVRELAFLMHGRDRKRNLTESSARAN